MEKSKHGNKKHSNSNQHKSCIAVLILHEINPLNDKAETQRDISHDKMWLTPQKILTLSLCLFIKNVNELKGEEQKI